MTLLLCKNVDWFSYLNKKKKRKITSSKIRVTHREGGRIFLLLVQSHITTVARLEPG